MNADLNEMLEKARKCVAEMSPAERAEMLSQQRRSYVLAEAEFGSDEDERAYREALADKDVDAIQRLQAEANARREAAAARLDQMDAP